MIGNERPSHKNRLQNTSFTCTKENATTNETKEKNADQYVSDTKQCQRHKKSDRILLNFPPKIRNKMECGIILADSIIFHKMLWILIESYKIPKHLIKY